MENPGDDEKRGPKMSFLRRLSYSLSFAIVISALSVLFYRIGGALAALPGMLLEGLVNVVIVEVTRDTFAGFVHRWMYFNVIFYTAAVYFVSLAASAIRNEKEALKAAGDLHSGIATGATAHQQNRPENL